MKRMRRRNENVRAAGRRRRAMDSVSARLRGWNRPSISRTGAEDGVAAYLQASDCFCLMSDYENYSNAAVGDVTGLGSCWPAGWAASAANPRGWNGFLVDCGDEGFCAHVARLREDGVLRERLRRRARLRPPHGMAQVGRRVVEIYERVLVG
jgi:hypothetical protein